MIARADPIDIGVFVTSLLVILVVGLRYGRSVRTLQDYALGGQRFTTAALTATIVATWITGNFLTRRIGDIYCDGLQAVVLYLCDVGTLVITGWILAIRMSPFLGSATIAEAMGNIYGRPVRFITAIFGLLISVGLIALQFRTGEKIFSALLGWHSLHTQVAIGGIIIVYSAFGGIRAITFTDVVQFFTFGTLIPILALIIWNNTQGRGMGAVITMFQTTPEFNTREWLNLPTKKWELLTAMPLYLIPALTPPIFQRITMAKSVYQARRAFLCASLIYLPLLLAIIWIAVLIRAECSDLALDDVFPYIVGRYVSTGVAGLLLAGLMAMIMSTADSNLNAAAVIFANDIVLPIVKKWRSVFPEAWQRDRYQLSVARVGSILIGLLALLFALNPDNHLYSKVVLGAWSYYMPVVSVPLLLAIGGFRSTTLPTLVGMIMGFITVLVWGYLFVPVDAVKTMIYRMYGASGMLANLLGLLGAHYLLGAPGGWQPLAPDSPLVLERAARRKAWQRHVQAIRNFRLYPYLQQNLPTKDSFYFFFGLYAIASTYTALYTIGTDIHMAYRGLNVAVYFIVSPIITACLTVPLWPSALKKHRFVAFLWPLSVGSVLFFANTLLLILSHFHHMQMMVIRINLLIAVLLLQWPLALFLAFAGIVLAAAFFQYYTGLALPLSELNAMQFKVMHGLLLFTSVLIVLFKGRQAYNALILQKTIAEITNKETAEELLSVVQDKARFLQAFRKAGGPALTRIALLSREIQELLQQFNLPQSVKQKVDEFNEQLAPIAIQLDRLDHRVASYLRLEVATTSVDAMLTALRDRLYVKGLAKGTRIEKVTKLTNLRCDIERIKTLIVNSVNFLRNVVGEEQPILISLEDTQLGYPRPSVNRDYVKKIASLRFTATTEQKSPQPAQYYLAHIHGASLHVPQDAQELPLAMNKKIVEAHYGYASTAVVDNAWTLVYVIPADLREVRSEDMDDASMELGTELMRADDTYPGAQEQEQTFLLDVEKKTKVDLDLVRKAIEIIKHYHGAHTRKSGEPFYLHPLAVAHIVLDYNQEEATILGALLHDTVEDTPMLLENIEIMFNKEVARIVDGVTRLDSYKETFYKLKLSTHENIRKLLEVPDRRALYVKIADRMHNIRTIQAKSYESQRKTAEETLLFFVPLSEGLGLADAAQEFKRHCFAVLNNAPTSSR